jgi:hypothetical protein
MLIVPDLPPTKPTAVPAAEIQFLPSWTSGTDAAVVRWLDEPVPDDDASDEWIYHVGMAVIA